MLAEECMNTFKRTFAHEDAVTVSPDVRWVWTSDNFCTQEL